MNLYLMKQITTSLADMDKNIQNHFLSDLWKRFCFCLLPQSKKLLKNFIKNYNTTGIPTLAINEQAHKYMSLQIVELLLSQLKKICAQFARLIIPIIIQNTTIKDYAIYINYEFSDIIHNVQIVRVPGTAARTCPGADTCRDLHNVLEIK